MIRVRALRTVIGIALAFVFTVVPVTLRAQLENINALALKAGTRARALVAPSDSRFTLITVASAGPDSLHYIVSGNSITRSLGWQEITRMEVSVGRHRHFGRGLGIGFLTGTLGGIALGAAGKHGEDRALGELGGAIGGASIGTIMGGTAGFFWRTEKWVPVLLPRISPP